MHPLFQKASGLAETIIAAARGLDEGPPRRWSIVSMKDDWKRVLAFENEVQR